ncbi:MAG: hypothetical protein ACRETW_06145 [Stenotrophobium sp.]
MKSTRFLFISAGLAVLLAVPATQVFAKSKPKAATATQAFAVINGNPIKPPAGAKNYTPDILKPDDLKWCVANIDKINATDRSVKTDKARVEAEGEKVNAESAALTRMGNELKTQGEALSAKSQQIEQTRSTIDKTKKASVDAFNASLKAFKEQHTAYDAKVKEYTSRGAKLKEQSDAYKESQTGINTKLDELNKAGAEFAQRCSNKNYYEDDMAAAKGK